MLFFHTFTGGDVVSACSLFGLVFSKLSEHPPTIEDNDIKILEHFVVLMYDRSSARDGI